MADLATLQQWRERLLNSRFSGVREVHDQNGETVVYRSDSEMARAIAAVDTAIDRTARGKAPNTILFSTTKGV